MKGDLTINCFKLARDLKMKPEVIAEKVNNFLSDDPDALEVQTIKAFVNFDLKPEAIHVPALSDPASVLASAVIPDQGRKKILVEYSAPNTNKPMHLGHLRNNTLGLAVTSILKKVGHEVISVNLINDRGIHICKSMLAYMLFGNGATPESSGKKGDHFVGDFYVLFDKEFKRQTAELKNANPQLKDKPDEELFLETEIGRTAQDMLLKWENGDPEVIALWGKMNSWVFAGFKETYGRMGVEFDRIYYESKTYLLGKDVVQKGLDTNVFQRRDDGSAYIDLDSEKLGVKTLLRSNGTSVYITQDLGATIRKFEDFSPDRQIWIVADEQSLHFRILFAILKRLGYAWAANLFHLSYGMVNLPSGKMKSREGTVVDADDLFDEMHALARKAAEERYGENLPDDIDHRCETIGLGAIKFMLLKFNPKTTMMFDPNASLRFEGDTGPYVQYACARIKSIIRKQDDVASSSENVSWNLLDKKEEKELSIRILFYPYALRESAEKLDPSILTNYLLELSKSFNRFYKSCSVNNAESPELRAARLKLCIAVMEILSDGLGTLSIDVPEAM